jgi:fermentation-respiration switch protein FrsA (DUF1100 family)
MSFTVESTCLIVKWPIRDASLPNSATARIRQIPAIDASEFRPTLCVPAFTKVASVMRYPLRALASLAVLYVAAVALLAGFQRALIYAPDPWTDVAPDHYAMLERVGEVSLQTADGLLLRAWYVEAPAGRPTVVIFPGQGGSLRSERYRLQHFRDAAMGVLLVAYRGYSGNPGAPSEQGLYVDARAALDWLASRGVADASLVLYGASLGTGVATAMAAERTVGAVVLEAPYTSIVDVAAERFPGVPVAWLLRDRFDSFGRIAAVTEPVLVLHGANDKVVPQRLGRKLYAAAGRRKEAYWPANVGHNDIFDRGGFERARGFIERIAATSS